MPTSGQVLLCTVMGFLDTSSTIIWKAPARQLHSAFHCTAWSAIANVFVAAPVPVKLLTRSQRGSACRANCGCAPGVIALKADSSVVADLCSPMAMTTPIPAGSATARNSAGMSSFRRPVLTVVSGGCLVTVAASHRSVARST